jgi:hypothetical protein
MSSLHFSILKAPQQGNDGASSRYKQTRLKAGHMSPDQMGTEQTYFLINFLFVPVVEIVTFFNKHR